MKKFISLVMSIIMVITIGSSVSFTAHAATWNGKAASSFAGGNGTKSKPYLISNAAQLARMRNLINSTNYKYDSYRKAYYKLTANINLNNTSNYSNWASSAPANAWIPIGSTSGYPFYGSFDGAGYTISGLYVKKNADNVGLFSRTAPGSKIKNVKISKSYISGYSYVGAVVGYVYGSSSASSYITGCTVSSTTVVGRNHNDDKSYYIGGIVGEANSYVYISSCKNSAKVSGYAYVGGIAGELYIYGKGGIYSCSNSGTVRATNGRAGGICSYVLISDSTSTSIKNNTNTGTISANSYAGGIFGTVSDTSSTVTISKCYNKGTVNATDYNAGGIFGFVSTRKCNFYLTLCYNTAEISASSNAGGLIGGIDTNYSGKFKVFNCSNDASTVKGDSYIGGIAGNTAAYGGNVQIINTYNKAYVNVSSSRGGGIVGSASISNYENNPSKLTIQNNIVTNSVSTCDYRGTVLGYIYISDSSKLSAEISNNKYLTASGNIIGETYSNSGKVTITSNSSASAANLKNESYLNNYGFYVCMWSFSDTDYPKVNLNGSHTYVQDSVTRASTANKKNGKIYKHCVDCSTRSYVTLYYAKSLSLSRKYSVYYGSGISIPAVTVKDSTGAVMKASNYTVKCTNKSTKKIGKPKAIGEYTIKVTMRGNYSGSLSATFTVKPQSTNISKLTKPATKQIKVKWNKAASCTGYQIQYSTSSKFSNSKIVTVGSSKTTSKTIKKLSKNKKYYVRIRTYKNVKISGKTKKIYSSWSSAKSIKTK